MFYDLIYILFIVLFYALFRSENLFLSLSFVPDTLEHVIYTTAEHLSRNSTEGYIIFIILIFSFLSVSMSWSTVSIEFIGYFFYNMLLRCIIIQYITLTTMFLYLLYMCFKSSPMVYFQVLFQVLSIIVSNTVYCFSYSGCNLPLPPTVSFSLLHHISVWCFNEICFVWLCLWPFFLSLVLTLVPLHKDQW